MKWKSLFAAALTAAVAWPALAQDATGGGTPAEGGGRQQSTGTAPGRVISVNFGGGKSGASYAIPAGTAYGLVSATNWNNTTAATTAATGNAIALNASDGTASGATLTYEANATWSDSAASDDPFLQYFLGDNLEGGTTITVSNVPFDTYDVIVYLNSDTADTSFLPVSINNIKYIGDPETGATVVTDNATATFGQTRADAPQYGLNTIRVNGITGATLNILGSQQQTVGNVKRRCNIAGFQIVESLPLSISVNMKGNVNTIVGTSGTSGLLPVPNAYWNELQTSADSGGSETIGALRDAAGETTSLSIGATYAGGAWNLPSAGRNTLGDMANGYRDTKQLTLTAVPYSSYDLILYFGSDLNGDIAKPWTPVQVTDVNGESKWYSYPTEYAVPENGAAQAADENPGDWGTTADCHTAGAAVAYGKAVMKIADLSGDVTLAFPRNTDDNGSANRSGLYGFQIVCTGELLDLAPTISVNIADVRTPNAQGGTLSNPDADVPTMGMYGLVPALGSTWANLRPATVGADGTETVTTAYACGFATPVRVSYQASGTWEYVGAEGAPVDSFLRYYLDDGVSANGQKSGADIYVTNIPFSKYDVIVYLATDADGEKFNPVEINGTLYKGAEAGSEEATSSTDVWGTVRQTAPALGANALRVSGLEGNLRIHGGTKQTVNNQVARGGIAAFQIVLADDGEILESVDPDRGVLSLNFNSGRNNAAVPDTNAFYGLDAVPGWAWYDSPKNYGNDGSTAITSEETVSTAYGSVLESSLPVTISAANGYFYSSNDPFMRAYLDDNARVNISSEVPYDYYDVIVYSATDGTGSRFQAVGVNGTDYRWRDDQGKPVVAGVGELFGWGGRDAAFGQNAQRINGQTANPLTVTPRAKDGSYRSGIAAIQIIERPVQEIEVSSSMTAQQVFAQSLPGRVPKLVFVGGGAITGAVNLSGVAVDLTQVTTSPFTGDLTVNANTKLYLPAGTRTYALTTGTVAGTLAAANVFIGGTAIPADAMTQNGADLTFNIEITYNWTGKGTDTNWSTPGNWSSHAVPTAEADVSIPLAAGDKVTIELPADAVAKSVTITGPESGTATLALTSAAGETGLLTISGQMLTTGNVTVTQSADITVNGKSTMVYPSGAPQTYPERGAFHVEGAQTEYKVVDGTLSVPTTAEVFGSGYTDLDQTAGGFVVVCDNAKLTVGGGNAEAVLSVYSCRMPWPSGYPASGVALAGTVEVLSSGVFETDKNANFAGGPKLVTNGGTVRVKESSASVTYGSGYAPTSPLTLSAPEGAILTFSAGESGTLLTGSADVSIEGPGTVALVGAIDAQTYTGEISVQETGNLTLADNQRPKLSVASGASLTVTPSDTERENGSIVFPTSMTTEPGNVTYTVSGLAEGTMVKASVDANKLTLYWTTDYPTLSTSSNWSTTANWTNLPDGTTPTYPTSDSVTLDGTKSPIKVTLDTDLSKMTSIFVKGNVTLVTNGTESTTIPACVALTTGATLTIDANFSGEWTLPAGYTLQVTKGFTSFANLKLEGAVVILSEASGTAESPTVIEAPSPVEFNGGLTIAASNLTLTSVYNVGKTLALAGDNITIAGNSFFTDTGTQVVNTGTDNAITGMTGLNGSLEVKGTLALTLGASPTNTFSGATIAADATLTLAAVPDSSTGVTTARGWFFPVTGDGTLEIEVGGYDFRPMFSAVSQEATTLPKNMVFTATAAEQAAGVISCLNNANSATLPEGLTVTVNPAKDGGAWAPKAVLEKGGNSYLRIYNQLPTNLPAGVDEAVAAVIQQAAETAGLTKGYTVQLTTKGHPVEVTADMLNEVLGCFIGLKATANAEGTTLTYAYDFGIVGIKRDTAGWVVTAKVQGAGGAVAGFAKGNAYTLSVKTGSTERNVNVQTVDESAAATGTVELTVRDTALQDLGDEPFTVGVKVARPESAPAQ